MLNATLVELRGVTKAYGGLRPLRMRHLAVAPGEVVIVEGPDEAAASVLVDLVTATTLPDAGEVRVNGRPTSEVADETSWLRFLELFGLVSPRVVLLDELSVLENLAVPLTLELDPMPDAASQRAHELAALVGIDERQLDRRLAGATPLTRLRVRLGRALAHAPGALLVEHPTVGLEETQTGGAAAAIAAAARGQTAALVITCDRRLAQQLPARRLEWNAATGELRER